jgi:hypothetical protein
MLFRDPDQLYRASGAEQNSDRLGKGRVPATQLLEQALYNVQL